MPRLVVLTTLYVSVVAVYLGLVAYEIYRVVTNTSIEGQSFQGASGFYIALLLMLALLLFTLPAYLVAKTADFLHARGRSTLSRFSSVALFVCYGISLPILQGQLNEEWKAQPNSAVNTDAAP